MFYNVEFFFEKPLCCFTSKEETPYTVSEEDYLLYVSGEYIKGEDGLPKLKTPPIDYSHYEHEEPKQEEPILEEEPIPIISNEHILMAIAELSEMVATLKGKENE